MITITGATGSLGGKIIDYLLQIVDAAEITAVARTPAKAINLTQKGITVRQGDYGDYDSLVAAFANTDTLMFISNSDVENRIAQHQNVVNAAQEAGVKYIVYTSFVSVGGGDILATTHEQTEKMIIDSGLAYTFLRYNFYMDMYVVEVEITMKTGAYRSPSGEAGAAFVSRNDVARTAAAVLTSDGHEGQTYDLTGPSTVTPADFAAVATKISGKLVVVEPITWDELAEDYRGRGMAEEWIPLSIMLEKMIATNALAPVSDDIARVTGTPPESFKSFVRKALALS